jgi:DNA-binding NarL/FixJ family response regulator
MPDEKESDRSRRTKRRGQQEREKSIRRASLEKTARLESKTKDEKGKLDLRIAKLIEQGYSVESVAKRLGLTPRRVNAGIDAASRQ